MKYTLSVLIEDDFAILNRICGVFTKRGFNIESLCLGPAEHIGLSKIIIVLSSDIKTIEQLIKQLYKLINVIEVQNITRMPSVESELMLLKVRTKKSTRSEILEIGKIFKAKVIDLGFDSLTFEITGNNDKMVAIEQLLFKFGIKEISRTGKIALSRAFIMNKEYSQIYEKYRNWGKRELNPHSV
jgi:acetolactate synthase-1/3 small subunit